MQNRVYLDWNATTPLRPEAREAMAAAWDLSGNPSSVHAEGRASRRLVEDARAVIAEAAGADATQRGFHIRRHGSKFARTDAGASDEIPAYQSTGWSLLPSNMRRYLRAVDFRARRSKRSASPSWVSSIWIICGKFWPMVRRHWCLSCQRTTKRGRCSRSQKSPASSMTRAVCCTSMRFSRLEKYLSISKMMEADLISVSAHKIGGPKGIGCLVLAEGLNGLEASIRGGGQEQGRRAGTENVSGIAGFSAAVKAAMASLDDDMEQGRKSA